MPQLCYIYNILNISMCNIRKMTYAIFVLRNAMLKNAN